MEQPGFNRRFSAAKALALLVMISLIRYLDSFALIFSAKHVGIIPWIIALLVVLSGITAIFGLFRGNKWGFIPLYFFIPGATLFFGMSLIPYLPLLIEPAYRGMAVVAINCGILIYAVWLLLRMMERHDLHY
ncbi:hypothetical protein [Photobacterium atrarenae]|uniref:Uncharacterized protein n=1 Tax=Photobacterium atrarenae TaxID=865757 RepID=A0ABY5GEA2_9GAMM|nr:hypothetical protein [Photobacterium atrarenae]UTV27130.1 hypothetical protein NNL38_12390 [Photobacterium atrarenae]